MPIYMDSHEIHGVSPADVAKAHQEDLKIQHKYGCKGLTYWFDEERGSAFCLIEAPNKNAVNEMHNKAHGLIPNKIVEVEDKVVEAFLGRIKDPKPEHNTDENGLLIINDPAFRTIMAIRFDEIYLLLHKMGKHFMSDLLNSYNKMITNSIQQFNGRKIDNVKEGILVSFNSVKNAIKCAQVIFDKRNEINILKGDKLELKIGISAGVPVTESDEFFGEALIKASILCNFFRKRQIMLSPSIKEYTDKIELNQLLNKNTVFINNDDEIFLIRLSGIVDMNWNNSDLSVEFVSKEMGLSKSHIYRKMKSLIGISLLDFIKAERMRRSIKKLAETNLTISEVAYDSGFNSSSYFSKCFKEFFKFPPTEFLKQGIKIT